MEKLKDILVNNRKIEDNLLKNVVIFNVKDIMSRNAHLSIEDIMNVGIVEDGSVQFRVPTKIKDRQILYLLAYLMWFWDITKEDLE